MTRHDLFSIPLYRFNFSEHTNFKAAAMNLFKDNSIFNRNTRSQRLHFTHPNLHRLEIFKEFTDFCQASLERVMDDMGFLPNIQITSMWGTRHPQGGYHHRHGHGNTFLAGVYYLHGTKENSGTIFFNDRYYHQMIQPALSGKRLRINSSFNTKFEEGTMYIFPSYLQHQTNVNDIVQTNSERYILGFNSMPVGKTNQDEFDRFNYQSVDNVDMINYNNEKVIAGSK